MPDYTFRPSMQINPDGQGRGVHDDETVWDSYGIADWVVALDGMSEDEREQYRSVMPEQYWPVFFQNNEP